ncbi:MAG: class I SAM-dependent methyltransferase [Spartobacteria bacterium]|nr:class I SAM-dependent methyltransferase [Spartobacteria bacterium]
MSDGRYKQTMKKIISSCVFCCSKNIRYVRTLKGSRTLRYHPLFRCKHCHTLFQRPDYTECEVQLQSDYEWHVAKQHHYAQRAYETISNLIQCHPSAKTLLDIGCGIGISMKQGQKTGLSCFGVEPNPFAAEHGKSHFNLNIKNTFFNSGDFDRKFDLIIMDNVLEHVPNPDFLLKDVLSVLAPSGLLFLAVPPNTGGLLKVKFSLLFPNSKYSIFVDNDVHINHFFDRSFKVFFDNYHGASIRDKIRNGEFIIQKSLSYVPVP